MVSEHVDRRRRSILQLVAAGLAGASVDVGAASEPGQGDAAPPMTQDRSWADFFVEDHGDEIRSYRGDEETAIYRGDASTALQRAIDEAAATDEGGMIGISGGTFELAESVTLASSTWVVGNGSATTLEAADGLNDDLVAIAAGAEHAGISRLRLDGNREANEAGSAIHVRGGAWRPIIEHVVVREAAAHGVEFSGGDDSAYSYEPVLLDVDVGRCSVDGFVFGYTGDLFGANLYAEGCGEYGFTMADAGGTVVHAHAYDTRGEAGIRVLPSARDLTLIGAHAERNHRIGALVKGERIRLNQAFVANNSQRSPGEEAGIVLDGAHDCSITDSSIVNGDHRELTQGTGLIEMRTCQDNMIRDNLFRDNLGTAVARHSTDSNSMYRQNRGYRTENGGESTVRDGERIAHELDVRPGRYRVDSTNSDVRCHVVDADETSLEVELREADSGEVYSGSVGVVWDATAQ